MKKNENIDLSRFYLSAHYPHFRVSDEMCGKRFCRFYTPWRQGTHGAASDLPGLPIGDRAGGGNLANRPEKKFHTKVMKE